jgi:hypothetical protein
MKIYAANVESLKQQGKLRDDQYTKSKQLITDQNEWYKKNGLDPETLDRKKKENNAAMEELLNESKPEKKSKKTKEQITSTTTGGFLGLPTDIKS